MYKQTCQQCNKEFEAKRKTAKFCCTACRVGHDRKVSVRNSVTDSVTNVSVTEDSVTDDLKTLAPLKEIEVKLEEVCTPEELADTPNLCITKKEQKESIYRLENNDLELLKIHKIYIPAWREKGNKYPQ